MMIYPDINGRRHFAELIEAIEREAAALDVERLARALHEMGDCCGPFSEDHPVGMHNSQAAAVLARLAAEPSE